MRARTTKYLTALTIHVENAVNKPQDMEWSSVKNTSVKGVKNRLQDTIGGAAARKALTNKDQNQESPKERYRSTRLTPTQLLRLSSS